ncbi:MAG: SDR family NAD(P)-dependent oxidoreductase, partial [Propionibacteriaceae bacterium]
MRFRDRVVLVTGGSNGIGRATVERFLDEGASVAIADLERDTAESWTREHRDHGRVIVLTADVTDRVSVDAAVNGAVEHFGRLDTLVTVAGGSLGLQAVEQVADEDWNRELDLNLTGTMRCIRAAIPHLTQSGVGASIVAVSSVNGLAAFGEEPYSSAKAGISQLARNLAVELGSRGVRINVVAPGTVRTRVWDSQGGPDRLGALYPLGRVGEPSEIAAAIAFLASADAS